MTFPAPRNKNYCATIVKVKAIVPLQNCDNVVATNFFGFQAIVNKETQVGDYGILLPAEVQLSDDFCKNNNLYRHSEKNKNKDEKGYLEDNRRVRAIKFRGHRSDCLFMPISSLEWTGAKLGELKEGDEFDILNKKEICQKYVIKVKEPRTNKQHVPKVFKRVDPKHMPEHVDSDNFFKYAYAIPDDVEVIVTQKLHGTSIRIGNTIVKRKLNIAEWLLSKVGIKIQETETDYVYGSRRVVKDVNNPYHNHFYDVDIWTLQGQKLDGLIPENYIVYGELIGWTPTGAPIQQGYTYQLPEGKCELYVYRVAHVNSQGFIADLSWDQVKEFCVQRGISYVPEIGRYKMKDVKIERFLDKRLNSRYRNCLSLDNKELVDEGVCVRLDKRIVPYILKAKSPIFLQHETKLLDKGVVDLETQGSQEEVVEDEGQE
jgi:hypothetical protein